MLKTEIFGLRPGRNVLICDALDVYKLVCGVLQRKPHPDPTALQCLFRSAGNGKNMVKRTSEQQHGTQML
jgi:hypothetical protein